jgi:hypothetical protein
MGARRHMTGVEKCEMVNRIREMGKREKETGMREKRRGNK